MGKYTRKAKVTLDVAVMDVSQSYLGVRTRAKTLALQRLQSVAAAAPPPAKPDVCYLELRSRRLEKPMQPQNSRNVRHGCGCGGKEEPDFERREECSRPGLVLGSIEVEGLGIEASFGENNLDFEDRERSTRESTPCSLIQAPNTIITPSLIQAPNTIITPGSTTKKTCSSAPSQRIPNSLLINVPSELDLEEFFAREEQSLQQHFVEKYNFDFVNDLPLPGRYEWVAVRPRA